MKKMFIFAALLITYGNCNAMIRNVMTTERKQILNNVVTALNKETKESQLNKISSAYIAKQLGEGSVKPSELIYVKNRLTAMHSPEASTNSVDSAIQSSFLDIALNKKIQSLKELTESDNLKKAIEESRFCHKRCKEMSSSSYQKDILREMYGISTKAMENEDNMSDKDKCAVELIFKISGESSPFKKPLDQAEFDKILIQFGIEEKVLNYYDVWL